MRILPLILAATALVACDDGGDPELESDAAVDADSSMSAEDDLGLEPDFGEDAAVEPDAEVEARPAAYVNQCAGCHGPEGRGTAIAPEVLHPVIGYSTWVVRNGRPDDARFQSEMEAFDIDAVSNAELAAIWGWLSRFPQPETGEGLYLDYCGNCHGPDGRGGVVREGARHGAAGIRLHVRRGEGGTNYASRQRYMPAFNANVLPDEALDLIIEFLSN